MQYGLEKNSQYWRYTKGGLSYFITFTFSCLECLNFASILSLFFFLFFIHNGSPLTDCTLLQTKYGQQTAGTHSPPVPPSLLQRIVYCRTNIFLNLDSKVVPEEYDWISFSHLQCISNLCQQFTTIEEHQHWNNYIICNSI